MYIATPFERDGLWLRCALHAHTTNSDGQLQPEGLVAHYTGAGYDVLCITDHWHRTIERSTPALLVIPGIELNATIAGTGNDAHVLALGVDSDPTDPLDGFPDLPETVRWINEHSGVPYLAHTYWSGLRPEEFEDCPGLVGIEVWNSGCEQELGRGQGATHWDEVLERGRLLHAIATDDSHNPGFDSGFAWTWVRAAERSQAAVLAALREGSFYSSTGPEIHAVAVDDDTVEVRCSPAAAVTLSAGRVWGARVNAGRMGYRYRAEVLDVDASGAIRAARLKRPPGAPYGRIEVTGAAGGQAWTNPLWVLPR
jgi:hypothetical protein